LEIKGWERVVVQAFDIACNFLHHVYFLFKCNINIELKTSC
jgi:hypothetical protein